MNFDEKGMPEIIKKSSKAGDQFTTILDLQNNEEHVYFRLGIGSSVKGSPEKVYSPMYLKIGDKRSL